MTDEQQKDLFSRGHPGGWISTAQAGTAELMHEQRQQRIAESQVAIREVAPTAVAVIDAVRSFAALGREGVLTARLADGTQWRIDEQDERQLTAEEVAARARLHESFQ